MSLVNNDDRELTEFLIRRKGAKILVTNILERNSKI